MADIPIGDLTPASALLTTDFLAIEQGGVAKSITGQNLATFARAQAAASAADAASYRDLAESAADRADTAADTAETAAGRAEDASLHPPYIGENGNWYVWSSSANTFVDSEKPSRGATGATGETGNGISSVAYTSTSGLVDAYTITYTNGDTETFTVTNGEDGSNGADGVSPAVTIATITGGHRVTITDKDHPSGQSFDVMDGQMSAATYDPQGTVANAGGIPAYAQTKVVYRTVTLSSSGWSNKEQTVTVTGISATETDQKIEPMPAGASYDAYESCGVRAVAQAANSLTFRCDTVPSSNLTVYVCITELEAAT